MTERISTEQQIIKSEDGYKGLDEWILLFCGRSICFQTELDDYFERIGGMVVRFSDFQPNPRYESVNARQTVFVSLARHEYADDPAGGASCPSPAELMIGLAVSLFPYKFITKNMFTEK